MTSSASRIAQSSPTIATQSSQGMKNETEIVASMDSTPSPAIISQLSSTIVHSLPTIVLPSESLKNGKATLAPSKIAQPFSTTALESISAISASNSTIQAPRLCRQESGI